MRTSDCDSLLEMRLDHALFIYGFVEAILWAIITLIAIDVVLFGALCGPHCLTKDKNPCDFFQKLGLGITGMAICALTATFGVLHIIFAIILSMGIQHHNSALVLIHFVFGVTSTLLRIVPSLLMIGAKYYRGVGIAVLLTSVYYCVVLWIVFHCYQHIKSDHH